MIRRSALLLGALIASGSVNAHATGPLGRDSAQANAARGDAEGESSRPLKMGLDSYLSISSADGRKVFTDGMWAGAGPHSPSVGYLSWSGTRGESAKVSLGIGRLYGRVGTTFHDPVEAWVRGKSGKAEATAGKFWVPFGRQEWEYESKPGVLLSLASGPVELQSAVTHNTTLGTLNSYSRLELARGENYSVALSFGAGRGLM